MPYFLAMITTDNYQFFGNLQEVNPLTPVVY